MFIAELLVAAVVVLGTVLDLAAMLLAVAAADPGNETTAGKLALVLLAVCTALHPWFFASVPVTRVVTAMSTELHHLSAVVYRAGVSPAEVAKAPGGALYRHGIAPVSIAAVLPAKDLVDVLFAVSTVDTGLKGALVQAAVTAVGKTPFAAIFVDAVVLVLVWQRALAW